jgi:hypothetical protein
VARNYQLRGGSRGAAEKGGAGADPGFQVRGVHLKKICRAEGGAKIVGVFRVKNHDFTPKNHIFSNFRGRPPRMVNSVRLK